MAITRTHTGERGPLRPGDVVFHWEPAEGDFPLHVGIFVGEETNAADRTTSMRVLGLPRSPTSSLLGEDLWNVGQSYHIDIIGYRLDVEPIELLQVVFLAQRAAAECSLLGKRCTWRATRTLGTLPDGSQVFISGTCSQFVEHIYERAGLDLVDQDRLCDPKDPLRIYPSIQIRAFSVERYPLVEPWRDALARYPDCIEQEPVPTGAGGSQ